MAWDEYKYIGRNQSSSGVDTSAVTSNADGTVLERLEWVQTALGGTAIQLRVQQSASGVVEETGIIRFQVSLMDIDSGAIASANINITSITQKMERSRSGSAYSVISDPVVAFSKADGIVYMDYEFKAAQWQVGDMYRMSLSGITCTIAGNTAYVPAMIWSNIVEETEDIKNDVQYLYAVADGGTTYPTNVIDNSILSIIMTKDSGGDTSDFDNSTDSLEAISDKITDLQADVGNPSVRTNLQNIEAMLGNPDTAGKTVYEAVKNIREAAIDGSSVPVANTLSDILHKDGSYTYDNTTDSLEALADKLATGVGQYQFATTTEDLNQAANTYDLLTGTTQPVLLETLSLKMPAVDISGGALTYITIQTDDTTPQVVFNSTDGALANLTQEAELSFVGAIRINVGTKLQLTIAGGAAGSACVATITAGYKAITAGGTLA